MVGEGDGVRRKKLAGGVRVAILHPEWDFSCAACRKYSPVPDRRTGLPVLRGPREPTPCHKCEKVPAAVRASGAGLEVMRSSAADLTPRLRKAWDFYRKCRAVGRFPDDPLVTWCAAVLADVYDAAARAPLEKLAAGVEALAEQLAKKR